MQTVTVGNDRMGNFVYRDAKQAIGKIGGAAQKLPGATDTFLNERATSIERNAKMNAPVVTGNLRSKIRKRKIANGYGVYSEASYGGYVETGTRYFAGRHYMKRAIDREMPEIRKAPNVILRTSGLY